VFDPAAPLANRGPEALQLLLVSGAAEAHEQVRLLTLSELSALADAADQLANLARIYVRKTCEVCGAPIAWNPNEPTGQSAGWRHVDQPAVYRGTSHRAMPTTAPYPCGSSQPWRCTPQDCPGCFNPHCYATDDKTCRTCDVKPRSQADPASAPNPTEANRG
jgi:hypothetical protein